MKEINFRIIELLTHQVLIQKDWDEDEDSSPLVVVTFYIDGVKVSQKLGYTDEKSRDKVFETFTDLQVQTMLSNILAVING